MHLNAGNILLTNTAAKRDLRPCLVHTLQLAVNDDFKLAIIADAVVAASRIVSHFHQAGKSSTENKEFTLHTPGTGRRYTDTGANG